MPTIARCPFRLRCALGLCTGLWLSAAFAGAATATPERASVATNAIPASIERLHGDLWARFIYPPGLLLDYCGLDGKVDLPESADFEQAKPNALAWWSPKENGPFFTGLYLDGAIRRWALTRAERDRDEARQLAAGLMRCASVGSVPGFIARGVGSDGRSHYALGSDDQTGPWFYGLWRYVRAGLCGDEERVAIVAKLREVAVALEANRWLLPADLVGQMRRGEVRGGLAAFEYRTASRLLFISRTLHELTRDPHWLDLYRAQLGEKSKTGKTRLQVVAEGMPGEVAEFPDRGRNQLWIFVVSQAAVRELAELESDPATKAAYGTSLRVTAAAALKTISDTVPAGLGATPYATDWRRLHERWAPQTTADEAVTVARRQLELWKNRGRDLETTGLREPFCAAWLVALDPQRDAAADEGLATFRRQIEKVPWTAMHSSSGFFAEAAWYVARPNARSSSGTGTEGRN